MVHVTPKDKDNFSVQVEEGGATNEFRVTVDDDYHRKLTGGSLTKEELVRKSFEFLLQRESKESILSSFDLKLISRYFPEYEKKIQQQ